MGVIGKQHDQGEEQGGKNRDPALTVKSQKHRSQPKPCTHDSTSKLLGNQWNHGEAQSGSSEGLAVLAGAGSRRWVRLDLIATTIDILWLFELSWNESEGAGLGQQPGAKDPQGLRHRAGCGFRQ